MLTAVKSIKNYPALCDTFTRVFHFLELPLDRVIFSNSYEVKEVV
jgi:hypothetical protein